MKKFPLLLTMALISLTASLHAQQDADQQADQQPYRHIVLLKFKDDAPPAEVKKIEDAFAALEKQIDLITGFEWGTNESPEGLDQGFTHVYFVSFKDKAALEKYLPHPAHKDFVTLLKTQVDKVLVVDYVPKP